MARSRACVLPLFFLLVSLVIPSPSAAQLGGLVKKAAKKAVEEKVEDAIPFTPKAAPAFNDRVLEITPALLGSLMKGFDVEVSYAKTASKEYQEQVKAQEKAREEWEKAVLAHDKSMERYDQCRERFQEEEQKAAEANDARVEKVISEMDNEEFAQYVMDLALRGQRIAEKVQAGRQDPATQREYEAYQKDVDAMTAEQDRRMKEAMAGMSAEMKRQRTENPRLIEACGKEPERPVEPLSPMGGPEGVLAVKGAEAAGLTPAQYSLMRERVIHWAQADRRPKGMGFSELEIEVLNQQSDLVLGTVERMRKGKVPF